MCARVCVVINIYFYINRSNANGTHLRLTCPARCHGDGCYSLPLVAGCSAQEGGGGAMDTSCGKHEANCTAAHGSHSPVPVSSPPRASSSAADALRLVELRFPASTVSLWSVLTRAKCFFILFWLLIQRNKKKFDANKDSDEILLEILHPMLNTQLMMMIMMMMRRRIIKRTWNDLIQAQQES